MTIISCASLNELSSNTSTMRILYCINCLNLYPLLSLTVFSFSILQEFVLRCVSFFSLNLLFLFFIKLCLFLLYAYHIIFTLIYIIFSSSRFYFLLVSFSLFRYTYISLFTYLPTQWRLEGEGYYLQMSSLRRG